MASWGMPTDPTTTLADVDTWPDMVRRPPLKAVVEGGGAAVDRPAKPAVGGASGGGLWTMCSVFPLTSEGNKVFARLVW